LGAVAEACVHEFNPQEIANTLWSFGELRVRHDSLFYCLANVAKPQIDEFTWKQIAKTAWAFAMLEVKELYLFATFPAKVEEMILEFDHVAIAQMVWAFSTFGLQNKFWVLFNSRDLTRDPRDVRYQQALLKRNNAL
jgi:hypothetical protein